MHDNKHTVQTAEQKVHETQLTLPNSLYGTRYAFLQSHCHMYLHGKARYKAIESSPCSWIAKVADGARRLSIVASSFVYCGLEYTKTTQSVLQ